jgi:erythronate-4-phosphate dehydrogenase
VKIVADNKIHGLSAQYLAEHFELELLPVDAINSITLQDADILLCRSVLRVNQVLLDNTSVKIVATVTSGIDHIDTHYLEQNNIRLFSAPGSNAQGVVDYVLWMVAYLENKQVFSQRKKTAGVIGAGHVGSKVQNLLTLLGFKVFMNDPLKAQSDTSFISENLDEIAKQDLICIHAALSKEQPFPSYHLLSTAWFKKLNPKTVLINAARGSIIDTQALLDCPQRTVRLCLDVFENEPNISATLIQQALVATPHIAGHTVESFYRATAMVLKQIYAYLEISWNPHIFPLRAQEIHQTIDASSCLRWYDVILKLYNFHSELELTPITFYTLREAHRVRHDFATISIQNTQHLPEFDRGLLKKLELNIGE